MGRGDKQCNRLIPHLHPHVAGHGVSIDQTTVSFTTRPLPHAPSQCPQTTQGVLQLCLGGVQALTTQGKDSGVADATGCTCDMPQQLHPLCFLSYLPPPLFCDACSSITHCLIHSHTLTRTHTLIHSHTYSLSLSLFRCVLLAHLLFFSRVCSQTKAIRPLPYLDCNTHCNMCCAAALHTHALHKNQLR